MIRTLPLILMLALGSVLPVVATRDGWSTVRADTGNVTPTKTIWDGVYTARQAHRGRQVYAQSCSRCHGGDLSGSGSAPPLLGAPFFDRWHDSTLRWLAENIRFAMPHDFKEFLSADSARDVLCFLLEQNAVPPGSDDLPTDSDTLNQILITRPTR